MDHTFRNGDYFHRALAGWGALDSPAAVVAAFGGCIGDAESTHKKMNLMVDVIEYHRNYLNTSDLDPLRRLVATLANMTKRVGRFSGTRHVEIAPVIDKINEFIGEILAKSISDSSRAQLPLVLNEFLPVPGLSNLVVRYAGLGNLAEMTEKQAGDVDKRELGAVCYSMVSYDREPCERIQNLVKDFTPTELRLFLSGFFAGLQEEEELSSCDDINEQLFWRKLSPIMFLLTDKLTELDLTNCSLRSIDLLNVCSNLRRWFPELRVLRLDGNQILPETFHGIIVLLPKHLTELSLHSTRVRALEGVPASVDDYRGAREFALASLKRAPHLKKIDFRGNGVSLEVAEKLREAFHSKGVQILIFPDDTYKSEEQEEKDKE